MASKMRVFGLFVCLGGLWWLLSGYAEPLLLFFGFASTALVTWLATRMSLTDFEGVSLGFLARGLLYWPWLVREVWRSNIAVARIVLAREMPISPTIFRIPAPQKSPLGRVTYANSVTLTPGTVTLEVTDDDLEVHSLTRAAAADLKSGDMGARVCRLEGRL